MEVEYVSMGEFTKLTAVCAVTILSSVYSIYLLFAEGIKAEGIGWFLATMVLVCLVLHMFDSIHYRFKRQQSEHDILFLYTIYFHWVQRLLKDDVPNDEKRFYFNEYLNMKHESDKLVYYASDTYGIRYKNMYLFDKYLLDSQTNPRSDRTNEM